MSDGASYDLEILRLFQRVAALEKNAHEPVDFTDLIARLERLEDLLLHPKRRRRG